MTMRHRRIIVAQAALTGAIAIITMCSYVSAPSGIIRLSAGNYLVLAVHDGRARIFFLSSAEPMEVSRNFWSPGIWLQSAVFAPPLPPEFAGPCNEMSFGTFVRLGNRNELAPFGGAWRSPMIRLPPSPSNKVVPTVESSFVRFPLWPLAVLLMYVPVRRAIHERRVARRRIQNECIGCGYSLYCLTSARCPECGLAI